MTNNHTPGPWAVEKPRTRSIITSGYKIVAILESGHTDADAQLMAAAPDLLTACELWITGYNPDNPKAWYEQGLDARLATVKAIAKAKGETA